MARFRRLQVLQTLQDDGLVPVFYHPEIEVAVGVAEACARAGLRTFEFTNRGDGAVEVFAELVRRLSESAPQMIPGVGSIGDAPTAALYLSAGANFVVGPNLNVDVAKLCNRRKVAYAPGCGSATEIATAEELGAEIVKLFPGSCVGGPTFVKSILGPCPWTSIMPTGGVDPTEESLREWFGAGIVAAGIGSKLFPKLLIEARDWAAIEKTVSDAVKLVNNIRG